MISCSFIYSIIINVEELLFFFFFIDVVVKRLEFFFIEKHFFKTDQNDEFYSKLG